MVTKENLKPKSYFKNIKDVFGVKYYCLATQFNYCQKLCKALKPFKMVTKYYIESEAKNIFHVMYINSN